MHPVRSRIPAVSQWLWFRCRLMAGVSECSLYLLHAANSAFYFSVWYVCEIEWSINILSSSVFSCVQAWVGSRRRCLQADSGFQRDEVCCQPGQNNPSPPLWRVSQDCSSITSPLIVLYLHWLIWSQLLSCGTLSLTERSVGSVICRPFNILSISFYPFGFMPD